MSSWMRTWMLAESEESRPRAEVISSRMSMMGNRSLQAVQRAMYSASMVEREMRLFR